MDVEDFLRDDVSIEEYACESDVVYYFSRFICLDRKTPDGKESDDGIDDESEVGEGDTCNHGIWMDDHIGTREGRVDITTTGDSDSCDGMEELVGSVAEIHGISECYESEYEDKGVFIFHKDI